MNRHAILAISCLAILGAAGLASAQPTGCSPAPGGVLDSTFEVGPNWPQWTVQSSTVFGTPLCDTTGCGTGGGLGSPFAGDNWAWFGGTTLPETSTAGQTVSFPATTFLFLRFQLRVGAVAAPFSDTLVLSVSGTPVATFGEPSAAEAAYTERYVDVSSLATGTNRPILFTYTHPSGGGLANFTVDNVELLVCTTPVELIDYKIE